MGYSAATPIKSRKARAEMYEFIKELKRLSGLWEEWKRR
jgi:hypothetical protein